MSFLKKSLPKPLSPLMAVVAAALLVIEFVAMMRFFDAAHAPILIALNLAALIFAFCLIRDLSIKFASTVINNISHHFFAWLQRSTSRTFSDELSAHLVQKKTNASKLLPISRVTRKERIDFTLHPGAFIRAITLAPSFPRLAFHTA